MFLHWVERGGLAWGANAAWGIKNKYESTVWMHGINFKVYQPIKVGIRKRGAR